MKDSRFEGDRKEEKASGIGRDGHFRGNDDVIKPILTRVPRSILKSLQEEADSRDSSVNSLIVSILKKHSRWWRFQEKLGFMPLHKSMIAQLMDKIDEQAVEEVGRNQKDQTIKDVILFSNSNYNLGTFVGWIKLRCEVLGFQLLLRKEPDNNNLFIIINHSLGIKWSDYYKGMFEAVLQELLKPEDYDSMKFSLTNSSFSITISGMAGSAYAPMDALLNH